jgi:polysaccharide pyruvyl transferase WcaK-like protein
MSSVFARSVAIKFTELHRVCSFNKSIVLLGAGFSTPNAGIWALASGAIALALQRHPGARIYLLDYEKNPVRYTVKYTGGATEVELINIRFSKNIGLKNNIARLIFIAFLYRLVPIQAFRAHWLNRYPWIKVLLQADIIGSIAGGDSFSDIYGLSRLLYVSLPQILVLALGKPLWILPQTLGPFKTSLAKVTARFILKNSQRVFSRDRQGLETVHNLLGIERGKLSFCYDMGFALKPEIDEERIPGWMRKRDGDAPLVGLNVSGLLWMGGYSRQNMFGLKVDYRKLIIRIIDYYVRELDVDLALIPHVFGEQIGSESDVVACREVFGQLKSKYENRLHLIEDRFDQHEIKAVIGRCSFLIGSRMHACIAALSQGIPAVGLAYSRKFIGLYSSLELEDLVIDLCGHDEDSILFLVLQQYERMPGSKLKINKQMQKVTRSLSQLFCNF